MNEDGVIRFLVATVAFGMSVSYKAVHGIIHYGPAKNIEAFVQETERAGRDRNQRNSFSWHAFESCVEEKKFRTH